MQPTRLTTACKPILLARTPLPASTPSSRAMTTFLFPGGDRCFPQPLMRLLDVPFLSSQQHPLRRMPPSPTFSPRFDLREVAAGYELQGELPGLGREDIEVRFVDARTLVIGGRVGGREEDGKGDGEAATMTTKTAEKEVETRESPSLASSLYQRASVVAEAEEEGYVDAGASEEGAPTPTSSASPASPAMETNSTIAKEMLQPQRETPRYWVSERGEGEFSRSFRFPGTVDQEAVKASLRNGILSVVVPKLGGKGERRIVVE